ncbi:MAG TPA: acylphosphatase [Gammaproteobacteria bacterium]|nr:acylphosphatase [Gammaproteobacteria bacterium]
MQVCKRCLVSGRVQGVFYRASTAERARALGVTGHAKNLPDGRVEVLACGEEATVAALCEWLWQGPPAAKVTAVEIIAEQIDRAPTGFDTR